MGALAVIVLTNKDTEQKMMISEPGQITSFKDKDNTEQTKDYDATVIYQRIRGSKEENWENWRDFGDIDA
jgi:hypothetical protein